MRENSILVFDLDGTLLNSAQDIIAVLNRVIGEYGGDSIQPLDAMKYIGPPVKVCFSEELGLTGEELDNAVNRYRKIYIEEYIAKTHAYYGASKTLNYLRESGAKLHVATMKTKQQVDAIMHIFDFMQLFSSIYYVGRGGCYTKEQMLHAIRKENCGDKFFMIGDTQSDYDAAEATGYEFIFASYGYGRINRKNIDYVSISTITDLQNNILFI
ncbi:MAG: HAD family hydrolase [Lachnospiraceae bacterium]|nr:HAD family hydrolase [Lachnospiraceae bacterium]